MEKDQDIRVPSTLPEVREAKETLRTLMGQILRHWEAAQQAYRTTGEDYIRGEANGSIANVIIGTQPLPPGDHPSIALIRSLRDLRSETQAFIEYFTRLALGGSRQELDAIVLRYVALVAHYAKGQFVELVAALGSLVALGDLLTMFNPTLVEKINRRLVQASAAVANMAIELRAESEGASMVFQRLKEQLDTTTDGRPVVRIVQGMGRLTGTLKHCPALTLEILREIILNASKPQVGATYVGFVVSEENGYLVIEGENDGVPVPVDKTEAIFAKGESTSGGGFGLYFLRELIEESYGGTIICRSEVGRPRGAESASVGRTFFTIRLPLEATESRAVPGIYENEEGIQALFGSDRRRKTKLARTPKFTARLIRKIRSTLDS